jgi:hypothetical protein
MSELAIERLNLQISNAAGHEHRVQNIAEQAAVIIGEELVSLGRGIPGSSQSTTVDALAPQPVAVDLNRMDNESCARALADSVMNAIRLQVEG